MGQMYVANCLNEYYAPFSYTMVKSLFESNSTHDIRVFLLHDGLSEESTKNFFALAKEYNQDIDLIRVQNFTMDPKIYTYGGWNELTMYRLLLWDILPSEVDRVLHLDGDMLINKDLGELYSTDFGDCDLVACPDLLASSYRKEYCIKTHGPEFTHLFEEKKYFNAGMILMNVAKNRGRSLLKNYEELAKKLNYVLPYPDQDLLNLYHENKVIYTDTLTYNFPAYDGGSFDGGFDEARIRKDVAVVHYLDKKPWSQGDHKFYDGEHLWWDVFKTTPYKDVLKKDVVVAVLILDDSKDAKTAVEATVASGKKNLKHYFRDYRFVVCDAGGGIGSRTEIETEKNSTDEFRVDYLDCSAKDFSSVSALKNYVALQLDFDQILFATAGEEIGEPKFFDETKPEVINEVLIKEGIAVFDRALFGREVFTELGGFAEELLSDEDYELALRAFFFEKGKNDLLWQDAAVEKGIFESTYDTYAYVIGECRNELREVGIFDEVITNRLEEAKGYGVDGFFAKQLEAYLLKTDFKKPILILTGVSECQGALDSFAYRFGEALRHQGCGVIFGNGSAENDEGIRDILLKPLSAVVGFQTKAFGVEFSDGTLLGNVIDAPKFNFDFDHPIYLTEEFNKDIKNVYVLSQDETYAKYVNEKFPAIEHAYHFPPAGVELDELSTVKKYDLSFVGTYNDYRIREDEMDTLPSNYRRISYKFYDRQRLYPNERAEEALLKVLDDLGYELSEEEFVECLFAMGHAVRALMYYYRGKVVHTLLDGGVKVDVYSDSWKKAPFANHENLRIHDAVDYEESLRVMSQSKMSLNVMSWHKGGMTERLSNAMLNKSLCVTDETTFIKRKFANEMLQFNLEDFSDLPSRVKELLEDDNKRNQMIETAYKKAKETQTWECRAKEFVKILRDI